MIKINNKPYEVKHFPDGSQRLMDFDIDNYVISYTDGFNITWLYEDDNEMITIFYLVNHIRSHVVRGVNYIELTLPYVPNSRMDRVKNDKEVFTLKYFCDFINSLNFNKVNVYDTHSYVTDALINNINKLSVGMVLYSIKFAIDYNYDLIYFPDDGAMKRYKDFIMNAFPKTNIIYGKKDRDWDTGQIKGIKIFNEKEELCTENDIRDKKILMIDDIISYGGTMAYSADKLHEMKASLIDIYTSHLENSFFDKEKGTLRKRMENGTKIVNTIYTTNSIFNEKYNVDNFNIKVIEKF